MEIPEYETKKLSDAERFVIGFKQLISETNLSQVRGCKLGPSQFMFKDGTYFGVNWLLKKVGFGSF